MKKQLLAKSLRCQGKVLRTLENYIRMKAEVSRRELLLRRDFQKQLSLEKFPTFSTWCVVMPIACKEQSEVCVIHFLILNKIE